MEFATYQNSTVSIMMKITQKITMKRITQRITQMNTYMLHTPLIQTDGGAK